MTQPVVVDIPHQLGRAGARARMDAGLSRLASYVPGGHVTEQRWEGDTLVLAVEAMGQRVGARLTAEEANVHAVFELPAFLALMAEKFRGRVKDEGAKLLK